jgi:hypothetical protein
VKEYYRIHRLMPLWFTILLAIPISLGVWGLAREGYDEMIAGGPVFLLLGYVLVAGFVNRMSIHVDSHGVRTGLGPLPLAPDAEPVSYEEIVKVYVRHASRPTKSGNIVYLAAGVERTDGRWVDLSQPMLKDAEVWQEAAAIAVALNWALPVEELWGGPPKPDWGLTRGAWYWVGAILAGIGWGCLVQLWFVAR